ncbi:MAG: SDR family NAD(P)-dependent oxidoreductase [Candidatus Kapaibacterium sp.]
MNKLVLSGKTILISGGNRGIGLALSKKMCMLGAQIISLGRSKFDYDGVTPEFSKSFTHYEVDISNHNSLDTILREITNRNSIDILVNNAGISDFTEFIKSDMELAAKMINVNFVSTVYLTHKILPQMIEKKSGTILNISSVAAVENFANCSVYNATKAAVLSFGKSLRKEVRTQGVNVLNILPGATLTNIWDDDFAREYAANMMMPEDIADAIIEALILTQNNRLMIEELILTPKHGSL